MRVLFFGTDEGRFPSFSYQCIEALKKLGHEVGYQNFRKYRMHKTGFTNRLLNRMMFRKAENYNPDLLLVNKGSNILPGYIEKLSGKGIRTANWTLDDPFGKISEFNRIPNIREYDYLFVFDPHYLGELKEINPKSYYLPCAADPENVHKEIVPLKERKYLHDVAFIGSHDIKRESVLKELRGHDLSISGYRWDKIGPPLSEKVDRRIYQGFDMCRMFNLSRINVNIHAPHSYEGANIRTFEVPACNSFQLCDCLSEIPKLFGPGKEIVCYGDTKELKELIDYYLDEGNVEERDKITRAGHARVIGEHTIRHRMEEIIRTLR